MLPTRPASLEIGLNEFWTRVDVDLAERRVPGINETMRRVRRNNSDVARFGFARFIADRDGGTAFDHENDFHVRVRVQRRTFPGGALTM